MQWLPDWTLVIPAFAGNPEPYATPDGMARGN
jgi:hypothetical protein